MAKVVDVLGPLEVKRLSEPGLHPVGTIPGLRLNITKSGTKSWILRTIVGNKRSDLGLGSYPAVTLTTHGKEPGRHWLRFAMALIWW